MEEELPPVAVAADESGRDGATASSAAPCQVNEECGSSRSKLG